MVVDTEDTSNKIAMKINMTAKQHVIWMRTLQHKVHIDGLEQDCSNSSALPTELLQSCTKPSICRL